MSDGIIVAIAAVGIACGLTAMIRAEDFVDGLIGMALIALNAYALYGVLP